MSGLISTSGLFRETWRIYADKFLVLAGIAAVPSVLFLFAELSEATELVFVAVGVAFSIASAVALIIAITRGGGFISAYRDSAPYLLRYLWLEILGGFIVLGGFALLVVPGFIFAIWFVFSAYALVLESKNGLDALLLSGEYIRGYFWPVVWRTLIFIVIVLAAAYVFSSVPAAPVIQAVFGVLVAPFATIYMYLIYKNLKELKPAASGAVTHASMRWFFIFSAVLGVVFLAALMIFVINAQLLPQ